MADGPGARGLTRRQVLLAGVSVGGVLALQACGGATSTPTTAAPTAAP